MLSTILVIGGVLVGLFVLLALIVSLSSRGRDTRGRTTAARGPAPRTSGPRTSGPRTPGPRTPGPRTPGPRTPGWVADAGRPHPDTWGPLSQTSTEIRAIR